MHSTCHCSSHLTAAAVHACLQMRLLQAEVVLMALPESKQGGWQYHALGAVIIVVQWRLQCAALKDSKRAETHRGHTCAKVMLTWQIVAQHGQ